jgi:acyl-CoA dehydrogenase
MDFQIPKALALWKEEVRQFVQQELKPHDAVIEETGEVPAHALDGMRRLGLFGINTPREYGGLGHDMLGNCLTIEEVAKANIAYFYTSSMNVHIASKGIELDGSEAQRQRWLPELASGRLVGAYALTESEAGSDAAAVATMAARDGDQWVLNGRKRYITNAPIADLFTVFARTGAEEGSRGNVSAFLIEAGTPGLGIGEIHPMAGGRGAQHAEVIFEDCRIPTDNLLGAEGMGFETAKKCLDAGRLNWAAYSVGAGEQLLDMALEHVTDRQQFGKPLADNQGIQWMLADTAADLHAARLVCHEGAWRYEREPERRPAIGAMAKLVTSEMVSRVADTTVQLFGGAGYRKDVPVERIWREVRAIRILEGTTEIMRHIVAKQLLRDARRANAPAAD